MASQQGLGEGRLHYRCSSSIANWRPKLDKLCLGYTGPTIFFGCYHWGDYLRILFSPHPKKIFWCGSDILNISPFWHFSRSIKHYCENYVEKIALLKQGIEAEVIPMIFDDIDKYQICFKPSETPHVFVNIHPGREEEYGLELIERIAPEVPEVTFHIYGVTEFNYKNIWFHGRMPEERFNYEIKFMQAGLSLNKFGGFSEVVAKSILMGQYPISRTDADYIGYYTEDELIILLRDLKNKKVPHPKAEYWRELLKHNKETLLSDKITL